MIERNVLRYSPAGIPILDFRLAHASTQLEAGEYRLIEVEIRCLAIGEMASRLNSARLERRYRFSGFLAKRTRNSKSTVFHIAGFELYEDIESKG